MKNTNRLLSTALIGIAVVTLTLPLGRAAEAKTLDYTTETQPETELIARKFKKFKKFKEFKKDHEDFKKFKKFKKFEKSQKDHHFDD